MGDQDAMVARLHRHIGFDQIAATAHVRRDLRRNVADTLVKHELPAVMAARRVFGKARAEPIVQRQHLVGFRLLPPLGDHRLQSLRLLLREIIGLGEVAIEMIELPCIGFE